MVCQAEFIAKIHVFTNLDLLWLFKVLETFLKYLRRSLDSKRGWWWHEKNFKKTIKSPKNFFFCLQSYWLFLVKGPLIYDCIYINSAGTDLINFSYTSNLLSDNRYKLDISNSFFFFAEWLTKYTIYPAAFESRK